MKKHVKGIMALSFGSFLALGLFNALVISHESEISGDITYIKGLDEMYGVIQPGRILATNSSWKKLDKKEAQDTTTIITEETIVQDEISAAIGEDLRLDLVEVVNPKLWARGLPTTAFEGDMETSDGRIESLSINLPGREQISISFVEMNGNVFEYDYAGEIFSGMLYQVDPKTYMITLTNGPLEGTRLRFIEGLSPEQVEITDTLKQENNVEVGFFGDNEKSPVNGEAGEELDPSFVQAQMMNMDIQV